MRKVASGFLVVMASLSSGCSSLTGDGTGQTIAVYTQSQENKNIDGAKCNLTNDEGTWSLVTPASTMIHRSNKDLQVICVKEGMSDGRATVVSKTKANMWGNIVFGGGIGAIIDHNNGSAYQYPAVVNIEMGSSKTISEDVKQVENTVEQQPNENAGTKEN